MKHTNIKAEYGLDHRLISLLKRRARSGKRIVIMGATSGQGLRCAVILALAGLDKDMHSASYSASTARTEEP